MQQDFDRAFAFTVGEEGGFTRAPDDPGNWTGGEQGSGELKGTKYGISAAAYPRLDIQNLTVDAAKAIYRKDYWTAIKGDDLPAPLAIATFDAAVNSGVRRASEWLQNGIGAVADGSVGPATVAAAAKATHNDVALAISARLTFLSGLGHTWNLFGLGWTNRCIRLAMEVANV